MVRARGQRRSRGVVGQKRSALGREKHRDRGLTSARVHASPRGIARGFSRGFAHRARPGVPRGVAEVNDAGGGRGAGGISSREGSGMGARRRVDTHRQRISTSARLYARLKGRIPRAMEASAAPASTASRRRKSSPTGQSSTETDATSAAIC